MTSVSSGALMVYCFKCRSKTESKTESRNVEEVVLKNGRDGIKCVCTVCGTSKFRIGKIKEG